MRRFPLCHPMKTQAGVGLRGDFRGQNWAAAVEQPVFQSMLETLVGVGLARWHRWHSKIWVSYMDAIFRNEIGGGHRREGAKYALCRAKCAKYIYKNRYFPYIITYLYNTSALLPLGFSAFSPSGRGRSGPVARPFPAEKQEWRISNVFGWHRAGTEVARPCFGPFGGPFGKLPAGGTPASGPRRSWTATDGPSAFRGEQGPERLHGGSVTRRKASRGLSETSSGPRRSSTGPRPAVGLRRSPASRAGVRSRWPLRVYPITKPGRRCRKFWGDCLPSFLTLCIRAHIWKSPGDIAGAWFRAWSGGLSLLRVLYPRRLNPVQPPLPRLGVPPAHRHRVVRRRRPALRPREHMQQFARALLASRPQAQQ